MLSTVRRVDVLLLLRAAGGDSPASASRMQSSQLVSACMDVRGAAYLFLGGGTRN